MRDTKANGFVYQRIADTLRNRVTKSHRPGDTLPPEAELATTFSVQPGTIRQALDVLVREGLIRRGRGRGTVVVDSRGSGEFAVVSSAQAFRMDVFPYVSMVSAAIAGLIGGHNPRWTVKMHLGKDTASEDDFLDSLDLLEPDVQRRLRGVFVLKHYPHFTRRFRALRVPIVMVAPGSRGEYWVDNDNRAMWPLALAHLKGTGCRSIGLIGDFTEVNIEVVRHSGLSCRPEWMLPCRTDEFCEQHGYELFHRLWRQKPQPDGLFVNDDMFSRGVLRAITQMNIEMPRQLRLVSHSGRGVPLPYHTSVTRVEFDALEHARRAVAMMLALLDGTPPRPCGMLIPPTLIKGETT